MSKLLTPFVYKQNVKWNLNSKSKIDTVITNPILNDVTEATLVGSNELNSVNINGTSRTFTYIYNNTSSIDSHALFAMRNEGKESLLTSNYEKTKGVIEVLFGEIDQTITLNTAISKGDIPTIDILFEGKSDIIARNSRTFLSSDSNGYPSWTNMQSLGYIPGWIRSNKSSTENELKWKWEQSNIPFNPFVRTPYVFSYNNEYLNMPPAEEVFTRWYWGNYEYPSTGLFEEVRGAKFNEWEQHYYVSDRYKQLFSIENMRCTQDIEYVGDADGSITLCPYFGSRNLTLDAKNIQPYIKTTVIDSAHIKVMIIVPVRICYAGASRYHYSLSYHELDNYSIADYLTKLTINVYARGLSIESEEHIFQLDNQITVETDKKGLFPLSIEKSELLTRDTYLLLTANKWYKTLANTILTMYQKGKSIFECEVSGDWAIDNNVKVGDLLNVLDKESNILKRDDSILTFIVRNITKRYNNNEFIYELKLSEVYLSRTIGYVTFVNGKSFALDLNGSSNNLIDLIMGNNLIANLEYTKDNIKDIQVVNSSVPIAITSNMSSSIEMLDITLARCDSLAASSFANINTLKEIRLDNPTALTIGNSAFSGCTNLEKIYLTPKIKLTGSYIFESCNNLKEVWFDGTASEWSSMTFGTPDSNPAYYGAELHVRDENGKWIIIPLLVGTLTLRFIVLAGSGFVGAVSNWNPATNTPGPIIRAFEPQFTDDIDINVYSYYLGLMIEWDTSICELGTAPEQSEDIVVTPVISGGICIAYKIDCRNITPDSYGSYIKLRVTDPR